MSAETSPQYPLDLPEDILFTNMIAYHAYNIQRYPGATACRAEIIYDSPDPVSTLSLRTEGIPVQPRKRFASKSTPEEAPQAYRSEIVFHPPHKVANYRLSGYSFIDIDIKRPGKPVATPDDVPLGLYTIDAKTMLKIGRPDLDDVERYLLRRTLFAPYINQFVLRQDEFDTEDGIYRRVSKAGVSELKNLHNHMNINCVCTTLVRHNHYGTVQEFLLKKGFIG